MFRKRRFWKALLLKKLGLHFALSVCFSALPYFFQQKQECFYCQCKTQPNDTKDTILAMPPYRWDFHNRGLSSPIYSWCSLRSRSLTIFTGEKVAIGTSTKIVFQSAIAPFHSPGSSRAFSTFPSFDF